MSTEVKAASTVGGTTAAHSAGLTNVAERVGSLIDYALGGRRAFDVVAVMTLILLLFHANETWYLRVAVTVIAVAGLLFLPLVRQAAYWWCLSLILAGVYLANWDLWIVNHKFTMTWWTLAIACSLLVTDSRPQLKVNARLIIGLCFAFATFWKIISPEFPDGSFFHFTLLTDHRFVNVAELVGGVSPEMTARNAEAVASLKQPTLPDQTVRLEDTPAIAGMATFLSVWTIGIEGLIAMAFLWPGGQRFSYWRNWLLLAFMFTTFPIATVQGFAWLLAIMGLAQCDSSFRWQRAAYVLLFLALPLCDLPMANVLRAVFGGVTA